jgi:hypothetical protein
MGRIHNQCEPCANDLDIIYGYGCRGAKTEQKTVSDNLRAK